MSKRLNLVGEEKQKNRNFSSEKLVCFEFGS